MDLRLRGTQHPITTVRGNRQSADLLIANTLRDAQEAHAISSVVIGDSLGIRPERARRFIATDHRALPISAGAVLCLPPVVRVSMAEVIALSCGARMTPIRSAEEYESDLDLTDRVYRVATDVIAVLLHVATKGHATPADAKTLMQSSARAASVFEAVNQWASDALAGRGKVFTR